MVELVKVRDYTYNLHKILIQVSHTHVQILMSVQMESIVVLKSVPTPLAHTHVVVGLAIS